MSTEGNANQLATEIKVDKKLLDMIEKFDILWKLTFTSGLDINVHIHEMEEQSEEIIYHIRQRIGLPSLNYLDINKYDTK